MYANLNLLGRIVRKEGRQLPTGKYVLNFTVAINKKFGEKETSTFIDCVSWERQAEVIDQFFGKGSMIFVSCEPRQANYEDKDGKKVYKIEYNVSNFSFTGNDASKGGASAPRNTAAPQGNYNPQMNADFTQDEIPF